MSGLGQFKNPIPPLILTGLAIGCAYLSRSSVVGLRPPLDWLLVWAGWGAVSLGVGIMGVAAWRFRKAQTTLSPNRIDQAEHLVMTGLFEYSRNPMYLGMVLMTLGFSFVWSSLVGVVLALVFGWYLDRFQIRPEEKALGQRFGPTFDQYKKQTHRWWGRNRRDQSK